MKILLIRRDNIGDLVLTTPMFEALRAKYPDAYLAALVNSYNAPAIAGNPFLDAVFVYTKAKHAKPRRVMQAYCDRVRLVMHLRRLRFDYVLLVNGGPTRHGLKFARLLDAAHIVGFIADEPCAAVDIPVPYTGGERLHEAVDIFRLLAPLGIVPPVPGLTVSVPELEAPRVKARLPQAVRESSGPLIALHISARKPEQRWPIERFAAVAQRLHRLYAARFLLLWSPGNESNRFHPGDDVKAARLLDAMGSVPVAALRTETLAELIAALSLAGSAVLSDGGAMHIAAALGKPLVCLFGSSSAARWHPWGIRYALLQKPSRSVTDIGVEEVVHAWRALVLDGGRDSPTALAPETGEALRPPVEPWAAVESHAVAKP